MHTIIRNKDLVIKIYMILKSKSNIRKVCLAFSISGTLLSSGQSLTSYKQEAEQNNPEIKAMKLATEANKEKIQETGNLPNTNITTGYYISEPETRTGAQKARFSARQELPWFGTIHAKKETATAENEIYKNKLEITRRKINYQIEKQYYTLYELKAKQKILAHQDSLLTKYMDIALIAVENNNASSVDILKLNIAKNTLFNKQEVLKGKILTAENAMNQLLHRDGFDPLLIPDNLFMPDEEPTMMLDDITFHPEVLKYDHVQEVIEKKEIVNSKEALPSISLGLDYVIVQERPDLNFSDNGKDIIMPNISFSIPLFSKKHNSISKQYELQKEEAVHQRDAAQNTLEKLMEEAINNRITARINYNTQQKNIQQTKEAEKIVLSQYQTAQADFEELLEIQQLLLTFENKKIAAIAAYFMNTATLNYLR